MFVAQLIVDDGADNRMRCVHGGNDQAIAGPVVGVQVGDMELVELVDKMLAARAGRLGIRDFMKGDTCACDKDACQDDQNDATPIEAHGGPFEFWSQAAGGVVEGCQYNGGDDGQADNVARMIAWLINRTGAVNVDQEDQNSGSEHTQPRDIDDLLLMPLYPAQSFALLSEMVERDDGYGYRDDDEEDVADAPTRLNYATT